MARKKNGGFVRSLFYPVSFLPTRPSKLPSYRDLWKMALTRTLWATLFFIRTILLPSYRDLWKMALTRECCERLGWFLAWKHILIIHFRARLLFPKSAMNSKSAFNSKSVINSKSAINSSKCSVADPNTFRFFKI